MSGYTSIGDTSSSQAGLGNSNESRAQRDSSQTAMEDEQTGGHDNVESVGNNVSLATRQPDVPAAVMPVQNEQLMIPPISEVRELLSVEDEESRYVDNHEGEAGDRFYLMDNDRARDSGEESQRSEFEKDDTLDLVFALSSCRNGMGLSRDDYTRILFVVTNPNFKPGKVTVKTGEQVTKYISEFQKRVFGEEVSYVF